MQEKTLERVRVDKWLWAARFYKTRSLAKQAIEGGKVHIDGARIKASKDILTGMQIAITQGHEQKVIDVIKLSDKRRGAPEAATLYTETEDSRAKREALSAERKAANAGLQPADSRPNKKQRRQIHRFKHINSDDPG